MPQINFDAERSAAQATIDMLEEASSEGHRGAMVADLSQLRFIIDRGILALTILGQLRDLYARISNGPEFAGLVQMLTAVIASKEEPQPPKTVEGEPWRRDE